MHREPFADDRRLCGRIFASHDCIGGPLVLHLRGEFDCATADRVAARLNEAIALDAADVVIDLGGTTFVDSATVRALQNAAAALRAQSRNLVVRSPSSFVRRVFALCHATTLLESVVASPAHQGRASCVVGPWPASSCAPSI